MTLDISPYLNGFLQGSIPNEVSISGHTRIRMSRTRGDSYAVQIPQFAVLGRLSKSFNANYLTLFDPTAREILTAGTSWLTRVDFTFGTPTPGDTITIGEIVLTFVATDEEVLDPETQVSTRSWTPTALEHLRDWFNARTSTLHITATIVNDYTQCLLVSTIPGIAGNGRASSTTSGTIQIWTEEGADLVIGDLEQHPVPVGVAAFAAEVNDKIVYFVEANIDAELLVWPDSVNTVEDRLAALAYTAIRMV